MTTKFTFHKSPQHREELSNYTLSGESVLLECEAVRIGKQRLSEAPASKHR